MTIRKTVLVGLALLLVGAVSASTARGDDYNQKTILTFSHPFEIPGHVLPAGTYTFQLLDSMSDRHIVQVSNHDGTRHIGLVMAIANYRLTPTDKTVITFNEAPVGAPQTIRAWFYPGRSAGQEFVYPKRRALELAVASKVVVPAIAVDISDPDLKTLKTVPIVAITPERKEAPVAAVIQTTPLAGQTVASASTGQGRQLPQTASPLSLITLLGIVSFGVAAVLLFVGMLRRPVPVSVP